MVYRRLLAVVLAGCLLAGLTWTPANAAGPAQVGADGPVLVHALNGPAIGASLDPALDYEPVGNQLLMQIYDTLVAAPREAGGAYIPSLATGWIISADGMTYTFFIRGGVSFHNGAELSPKDVAYSFRRGLLMGGTTSPQWLLFEPLLGATPHNDISDLVDESGALLNDRAALSAASDYKLAYACQKVFQAVTYNEAAGMVTFHLAQPWNPFMETLTGTWGSILDSDWVAGMGGWDGQCATWPDYYATPAAGSPLARVSNGSGPYILTGVDENGSVRLDSNPSYWRSEPVWPDGPTGEAFYKTVLIRNVPDADERKNMLLSGQAQLASIDFAGQTELDGQVLFHYSAANTDSALLNPGGFLKKYTGLSASATDLFFNYNILPSDKYAVRSGEEFGDGIPGSFFADLHMRKAISYAFDWDAFIAADSNGQAVQRRGIIPGGFTGYADGQQTYSLDLSKAADEFARAWDGKLISQGFTLTLAANDSSASRLRACEILKANIESISPNYRVNILVMSWDEYLADYQGGLMPMWMTGWLADIGHPHNFVAPYLTGAGMYAGQQSLPADLRAVFEPKAQECIFASLDQAQSCYAELQNLSYDYAVNIWGTQPTTLDYTRAELQGFHRLVTGGVSYYALSETALPVIGPSSGEGTTLTYNDPRGGIVEVQVPSNALAGDARIVVTPGRAAGKMSTGFHSGELAFDISAYDSSGALLSPSFDPRQPVTAVIHYDEGDLAGLSESSLRLLYWNGSAWQDSRCGKQVVDLSTNTLTVPLCHFSDFALAGKMTIYRYLPLFRLN